MAIDLVLFLILAFITARGYRNGFIYTLLHTVGWIFSLAVAFFLTPALRQWMIQTDFLYSTIRDQLLLRMPDTLDPHSLIAEGIPKSVRDLLLQVADSVTDSIAMAVTDLLMSVIAFLILVTAAKAVIYLLVALFSKKSTDGPTGTIDGVLGLAFGFVKGMLILYLILALMIPAVNLASPDHAFSLLTSLNSSLLAKDLYDNNLLLLLFDLH